MLEWLERPECENRMKEMKKWAWISSPLAGVSPTKKKELFPPAQPTLRKEVYKIMQIAMSL
jgi:hypothetical protein